MNGESLNITQDNLDKLRTLFLGIFFGRKNWLGKVWCRGWF